MFLYFSRRCQFCTGTILLDLEESDFPHIISAIVEEMIDVGQIKEKNRQDVLRALLLKHRCGSMQRLASRQGALFCCLPARSFRVWCKLNSFLFLVISPFVFLLNLLNDVSFSHKEEHHHHHLPHFHHNHHHPHTSHLHHETKTKNQKNNYPKLPTPKGGPSVTPPAINGKGTSHISAW